MYSLLPVQPPLQITTHLIILSALIATSFTSSLSMKATPSTPSVYDWGLTMTRLLGGPLIQPSSASADKQGISQSWQSEQIAQVRYSQLRHLRTARDQVRLYVNEYLWHPPGFQSPQAGQPTPHYLTLTFGACADTGSEYPTCGCADSVVPTLLRSC